MKKILLAALMSLGMMIPAMAQSSFTALDSTGATVTFKSFNCSAICSLSVPADSTGAAFGVSGNPFYVNINSGAVTISGTPTIANTAFGISGTLPAFASTPTVNLGTINGIALDTSVGTTNTNLGAPGATACATDNGSCNLNALSQRTNQRITSLITALGSPFQAGGSISNTTFASTQSGTWTVQPGNTANTTPWLATISQGGNSATVSAGGALKVDGSAATQPVSGTVTANGPQNVTVTDCSSTITAGNSAQNAITASSTIRGFMLMNLDVTEPMWVSFTGTAAAASTASYVLQAGASSTFAGAGSFVSPVGMGTSSAVSVVAATTGHKFSCTRW